MISTLNKLRRLPNGVRLMPTALTLAVLLALGAAVLLRFVAVPAEAAPSPASDVSPSARAASHSASGLADGADYTPRLWAADANGNGAAGETASPMPAAQAIGGTWSFAIGLEPDTIAVGSATGALVTVVATFTAHQQNLSTLEARTGGSGYLTVSVSGNRGPSPLVGFGADDPSDLVPTAQFELQPDCVPVLDEGTLTCTYHLDENLDPRRIYAKANARLENYTVRVGSEGGTPTIEARVNGQPSTLASITAPGVALTVAANTAPSFGEGATADRSVEEDTGEGGNVGDPVTATDNDNDSLTYTLSSTGTDHNSFSVDNNGQITVATGASLDYEDKSSYTVTVSVHDGKNADGEDDTSVDATIEVTINVTNVDEPEIVTFSSDRPQVGTELTATLTDPDVSISGT